MTNGALVNGFSQPQPQPNQLSNSVIQTGRVIQSVMEYNSQLPVASTTLATKVEKNPYVSLFQKRKQTLEETCQKIKKNPREPFVNDPSHLFVLQDRGISWCPVFKAASTNWMQNIMLLSDLSKRQIAQLEEQYKQYVLDFILIVILLFTNVVFKAT